jgi:hypothetical protein
LERREEKAARKIEVERHGSPQGAMLTGDRQQNNPRCGDARIVEDRLHRREVSNKGSKAAFTDGLIETNLKRARAKRLAIEKVRTGNGGEDL